MAWAPINHLTAFVAVAREHSLTRPPRGPTQVCAEIG
jgi:hypothetical protein